MLRRLRQLSDARGAVVVFVAILLVPIFALASFAIDGGWQWVHERHLQTQVDAGSFAGGLGPWVPVCDDNAIVQNALRYSGDFDKYTGLVGPRENEQYTNAENVHVLVNSDPDGDDIPNEPDYWPDGSDYSEDGKTPCETLMDPIDPGKPAYLDLKATESDLALFLNPRFSFWRAIRAHARVALESQGGGDSIRPIAVRDSTAYVCAEIHRYSAASGAEIDPLNVITLDRTTGPPATAYTEFQNTGGTTVDMPTLADSTYVRVKLYANRDASTGACTGAGDEFPTDDSGSPVDGVSFINVFAAGAPSGAAPVPHSVSLTNGGCAPDQYFSFYTDNTTCSVTVVADVEFPASALDKNPSVEINGTDATPNASFTTWTAPFSIAAASGPDAFSIRARYNGCGNACQSFGVLQQAYSGLDDDGEPSSSGPISMVEIGEDGPGVGANSFQRQTSHDLVFTVRLIGLANSKYNDKPIVLRYSVQGSKRTGLVDCGQGNGAQADYDAVLNGCPRPVYIWPVGSPCITPTNSPAGTSIDCVGVIPGNRRNKIVDAIRDRIGTACNAWNAYRDSGGTTTFDPGDPRAITMIVTSPVDLSGGGGSTPDVPVLLFATFYVTGADRMTGDGTGCENEPYPNPSGRDNSAIWGHWIKWADPSGTGNGEPCKPNEFGNCVAVLTN